MVDDGYGATFLESVEGVECSVGAAHVSCGGGRRWMMSGGEKREMENG